MYFKSKTISLLILAISAIACSRILFLFFNDPEGPNLLVVTGTAAIVYFVSLAIYLFNPLLEEFIGLKRLVLAIVIQIIIVAVFYICLK